MLMNKNVTGGVQVEIPSWSRFPTHACDQSSSIQQIAQQFSKGFPGALIGLMPLSNVAGTLLSDRNLGWAHVACVH